jgi:hypothetical protein
MQARKTREARRLGFQTIGYATTRPMRPQARQHFSQKARFPKTRTRYLALTATQNRDNDVVTCTGATRGAGFVRATRWDCDYEH